MLNLTKSLIALVVVLTLYGAEARADSFVFTEVQGSAHVLTFLEPNTPPLKMRPFFEFGGPGLGIVSTFPPIGGGDVGNVEARDTCLVNPCTPGMVLGTNSSYSGILAPGEGGHARVNGVFYPFVKLAGTLNFVSAPIVLPNTPGVFHVTIPFTFSGNLTGDALQPDVVNPIFTAVLSGHGMATFHFEDITRGAASPQYRLSFIEYRFGPVAIQVDIKPATFPNSINPRSKGKIPVAILTTPTFNAATVDPTTVLFGATGTEARLAHSALEDVDGDGDMDLVCHFATQDTGITCGDTHAFLTGTILGGMRFKGSDFIETVACK